MSRICNRTERGREREIEDMGGKMDLDSKWGFSCVVFAEAHPAGKLLRALQGCGCECGIQKKQEKVEHFWSRDHPCSKHVLTIYSI